MTPEEHAQSRQHCLTASRAKRLLSGNYKTWNTLAKEMRAEQRILGSAPPSIPSLHWGVSNEAWVRATVWEDHPEWDIEPAGFQLFHAEHPLFSRHCGASPDGIIRPLGWGFECKAPYDAEIHAKYLEDREIPKEYVPQVQWSLWVTGWPKWLFASGDPRRQDMGQIVVRLAEPDLAMHEQFEVLASRFLESYLQGEEFRPVPATARTFDEMFK
jgi:hypothetical protein